MDQVFVEYRNKVTAGHAAQLGRTIPSKSIDVIATAAALTPLQAAWLFGWAADVLTAKGLLLCPVPAEMTPRFFAALFMSPLRYRWGLTAAYEQSKTPSRGWGSSRQDRFAWLDRNGRSKPHAKINDVITMTQAGDVDPLAHWLQSFCTESSVVADPFARLGSVGVACKTLGIGCFIGFDSSEERAAQANALIANAQPPLIPVQSKQQTLLKSL